jgi:hypothetical protein
MFGQAAAINGLIEGTVTDPTGAVVAGAQVSVDNSATGETRALDTNAEGLYRFPVLPLGTYTLKVSSKGFRTSRQEGIVLNAGTTATVNIALAVGDAAEVITVEGSAPFTELARTDFGSTLSSSFVQNLPLVSRNPYNFILVQPNVTGRPNTEFGVPRKVLANGFNNRINYQIDGNNNVQSDRAGIRLVPISNLFVGEVQQVSNGYAAEFGNTVGNVFNTITRSGTNNYHGEAAYIFRRTGFSPTPALFTPAPNRVAPKTNVNSFNGGVGGAVKKDRIFFYGAYDFVKRDLPQVVTVTPSILSQVGLPAEYADAIPFRQKVMFYIAKGDIVLNQNNRLTVRFNGHRNDSPYNGAGGLNLISRTYNFVDRSYVFAAQLVSVISPTVVNEFRAQAPLRNQQQQRFEASGAGPSIVITNQVSFGGSEAIGFLYRELAPEFSDNLSYARRTHSMKFGINFRTIGDTYTQQTFARYTFPTIQSYLDAKSGLAPKGYTNFTQTVGDPSLVYRSNFINLYAQDSWKVRPNITVSYGLRYDLFKLPTANAQSPLAVSQSFRTDKNNFGPRLAIAWGLGKDQKTVLRASSGIFYDAPQTDIYRRAILNNGTPIFFNIATGPQAAFAPSFPNVFSGVPSGFTQGVQDVTAVDPTYRSLYSYNANFSIVRQLRGNATLTGTYLYTKGTGLPIYSNTNLIASGATLADGRPIFGSARINPAFNNISLAQSVGNSIYNGMTWTLTKRFSNSFNAFASYTWAHSIDDAPEQNNIDSGSSWLADISNRRRDRGNSLSDRRHSFNASALYEPNYNIGNSALKYLVNNQRLSLFFLAMGGDVFNMGSNRVLNGDATSTSGFQRPLYVGRNTIRGPKTVQLDLRYSRLFPIREAMKAEFYGEFTNLFNRTNVTGVNSNATVDTAGNITTPASLAWNAALDQRLMQFGLRFVF